MFKYIAWSMVGLGVIGLLNAGNAGNSIEVIDQFKYIFSSSFKGLYYLLKQISGFLIICMLAYFVRREIKDIIKEAISDKDTASNKNEF